MPGATEARSGTGCPTAVDLQLTQQILDFAARHRLPTIFPARSFVDAGGLMSYGYDREVLLRRAASYVDRILRGASQRTSLSSSQRDDPPRRDANCHVLEDGH